MRSGLATMIAITLAREVATFTCRSLEGIEVFSASMSRAVAA
jgi:hypothetical protein